MSQRRTVFFISDRTGITAEMLGNSLLTQFEDIVFHRVTIPFVDSMEKAADAVRQVNATAAAEGRRPIVVSSVVDEAMSAAIRRDAQALTLDMPFIVVAAVIRTIDAVKAFDTIYVISSGGPGTASETINLYLYLQAFAFYNVGNASAVVVVFFAIIVALALLLLHVRERARWAA